MSEVIRCLALSEIEPLEVPKRAVEQFEYRGGLLTDKDAQFPEDFERIFTLPAQDGITSYCAELHKMIEDYGEREKQIYIVHLTAKQKVAGVGSAALNLSGRTFYEGKPFVEKTETKEPYLLRGLGRRRLLELNAATLSIFGVPLHSDSARTPAANGVWESLVRDQMAEKYTEIDTSVCDEVDRYRMLSEA